MRYWGLGKPLLACERDELIAILDEENKALNAPTHIRAIQRMKEAGIG